MPPEEKPRMLRKEAKRRIRGVVELYIQTLEGAFELTPEEKERLRRHYFNFTMGVVGRHYILH